MRLTHIRAENYQRLTLANILVRAPILVLAGANEQGKTSLADAINHALVGTARRVDLKKDLPAIVHDGQKKGQVFIELEHAGGQTGISVTIPADKRHIDGAEISERTMALLPYLLDPKRVPRMKPEERRPLLFSVTQTRVGAKMIIEKLMAKGATEARCKALGAVLAGGFAAAHDEAKAKASEARGSWKTTTGENYGSAKAETWSAEVTDTYAAADLNAMQADCRAKNDNVTAALTRQSELAAQRRAWQAQQAKRTELHATADLLERRIAKLTADQALVDEWAAKVAATRAKAEGEAPAKPLTCPHCSGLVDLKNGVLAQHQPPSKVADPMAKALLAEQERTLQQVTTARDNSKREVDASRGAAAGLLAMTELPNPSTEELEAATAALQAAQNAVSSAQAAIREVEAERQRNAEAAARTAKAKGYHEDVVGWTQMAEWLAPSGIQSEILNEALKPFNDRMAKTAQITGWDATTIDGDMTIRVGGRPFALCSASAQWRAEAAIAEAISHISGAKLFLLDEVELLIGPVRIAFLTWMHKLAAAGEVDTAILIGSFKEPPQCPPTFQVEWVEAGAVGREVEQAEAA